ncbi:MAG: acetamidase/formamidase family protein [Clostridia bacterium]|nr:acetamidase/formamidase family protein [Clostridia bacterium]
MTHHLDDASCIFAFSKDNAPVMTVPSGAIVCIRTVDCYNDTLRADNDPRGEAPVKEKSGGNPATGPIFVEGAEPGDTLKCEILSIKCADYGTMRIRPGVGYMGDLVTAKTVRAIPINGSFASLDGVTVPVDPMIGVIGVAPAGDPVDCETPGEHGGNMDTRHIREGSTLYLPVSTEGALFAVGDVHAQMGDGEVGVCGLECAADVTVRLSVIKGRKEEWPVLLDQGCFYTIASAETLDKAGKLAANAMHAFLLSRAGIENNHLIMLESLVCDLEVSQVVDPLITARMKLRPNVLNVEF